MKFLKSLFGRNAGLSREQRMFWEEKGYIVLESVFSENRIDAFWAEVEERWQKRKDGSSPVSIDILEGEERGKRMMFADADESIRDLPYKLNDLFIVYEGCRDVCLDTQMVDQLNELIDGEVSAINSLLFERGSQQPGHVDIYYMAPPV
jgi:phytanoyl-CoA hydroxylase